MTTYAVSADIIHAITATGSNSDITRCGVTLPKNRPRVTPISVRNGVRFSEGECCKRCFSYLEKK